MEKLNVLFSKLGCQEEILTPISGCSFEDLVAFSDDDWQVILTTAGLSLGLAIVYRKKIKAEIESIIGEDATYSKEIDKKPNEPDSTANKNTSQKSQAVKQEKEEILENEFVKGPWSETQQVCKAAGVLPISAIHGTVKVLVPIEYRNEGIRVHIFGGRREFSESPKSCAVREFNEETGKQLNKQERVRLLNNSFKYFYGRGNYCLYIAVVHGDKFTQLPYDYHCNRNEGAEAKMLAWIPLHTFLSSNIATINGESVPMSVMVSKITSCALFQNACAKAIKSLMKNFRQHQITIARRDFEALKGDKALATALHLPKGTSVPSRVVDLPIPPPSPQVSALAQNSEEFNQIMDLIPPEFRTEVRTIRKASVRARLADWDSKRTVNQSQELFPLFHGTPDTWRGTCIAYQGFDLNIKINGRAQGNGVYSTKQYSMARGYCAGKGSILCLRGQQGGKVKILGTDPVFVYPDTASVVVAYIIDIGSVDSKEVEKYEISPKEIEAKIEKIKQEMRKRLEEFKTTLISRTRATNQFYLNFIEQEHPSERLLREAQQYRTNLPIYSHKYYLIDECINNQLVIVGAETGSGKSTQLPQYLLDNVLDGTGETVLVLQPRRINAQKLAERVAFERGTEVGQEVGWRVGRGGGVWSPNCRILFLTHGLFVSWMLEYKELRGIGAVIIDEAHERSLEVDLVFGLIRQLLRNNKEIRVVVSSATLREEAHHFQSFLIENNPSIKSIVIPSLCGITFPVHIEYRQLVQPDVNDVGTCGTAKIRLSAAVQAVAEILEHSKEGNILVFVPGHSETVSGKSQLESILQEGNQEKNKISLKRIVRSFVGLETKIEVFSLDGQTSSLDTQKIFQCKSRTVTFATNVAETGVTLPNIRYVVDSGMNRTAKWDTEFDMNILITQWITKSAADQRCGRAGRLASGYCLRLYSEEEYTAMSDLRPPAIQVTSLQKTILSLYNYIQKENLPYTPQNFPLLTKISDEMFIKSCGQLVKLGALEQLIGKENEFQLTPIGTCLANLGIDLRLGRFLVECCNRGVGDSAATIAALVTLEANRNMIKKNLSNSDYQLDDLYHESGDHISLLDIYEESQRDPIVNSMLCPEFLKDMPQVLQHIHDRMTKLKMPTNKENDVQKRNLALEQALAITYFDQICVAFGGVESFSRKFVRVLTPEVQKQWTDTQARLATTSKIVGQDNIEVPIVEVGSSSSLTITRQYPNSNGRMIYGGMIQTDSKATPMVSWITFISEESYITALQQQNWCNVVDFEQAMLMSKRITIQEAVKSNALRRELVKQIKRKYRGAHVYLNLSDKKVVCVCDFEYNIPKIKNFIRKLSADFVAEQTILLAGCPSNSDFQKVRSAVRRKFENESIKKEMGSFGISNVNKEEKSVTITCRGDYKPMLPFICGSLQQQLSQLRIKNETTTNNLSSMDQELLERYQQLIAVAPTKQFDKNSCTLVVARILIIECKCKIYGGFVRDWLIRGELENVKDLDTRTSSISKTLRTLSKLQVKYGFSIEKVREYTATEKKIRVHEFLVKFRGDVVVKVDLSESKQPDSTVDASVNNVMLSEFDLQSKVNGLHNLSTIIKNIKEKKFHFYENWGANPMYAKKRLEKLLEKGFSCLSGVPSAQSGIIEQKLHHLITFT